MLRNYLTIALRALRKHLGYSLINVAGLAVGLAGCILIALFVWDELSYDRFHEKADRIYRVVRQGEDLNTSALLAPTMEDELPEVERAVRISPRWFDEVLVTRGNTSFYEEDFFFTDPAFFDVFSFPLIRGNPDTALERPFTVILTETMAQKYFGEANPLGQTLSIEGPYGVHDFTVTGVVRDVPHNSHFQFNLLASFATRAETEPQPESMRSWYHVGDYTYVLLNEENDVAALQAKMPTFYARHHEARLSQIPDEEKPDLTNAYTFQPITDIHLYSHLERELEPNSEVRYLYIFSVVALLILLIACINYMTLATARAAHRAREVGVRKVVGATRGQLARQFLGESILLSLLAMVLAAAIVQLSLPAFNQLTGKEISIGVASAPWLGPALLLGGLGIGLLAGSYPALFLSGFRPVHVLKGLTGRSASNAWFRSGLVTLQFAISIGLIAATLIVQHQLDYMKNKRLGLNPEQVLVVSTRGKLGTVSQRFGAFKQELLRHPAIAHVSTVNPILPARPDGLRELWVKHPRDAGSPEERQAMPRANGMSVGMDVLKTLDISLVKGRTFRPADFDSIRAENGFTPVLINQTAVRQFGWEEPIGKEFACCRRPTPRVVGVVEDFHYQSLKTQIAPLTLMPTWWSRHVLVRVRTDDLASTIDFVETQWEAIAPDYPFAYTFLDDRFARVYDAEERLAQVFGVFALLAIAIACLGLLGLVAYMASTRTKEIGIRKVLGASVSNVVALLTKDFLRLILVAFIVATPVVHWAMGHWLQDFAYRITLGPSVFLLAGAAALVIALATVSYQAFRAARTDPAEALRYE